MITAGQGIGPYLVGVSAVTNSDSLGRADVIEYLERLSYASAQPYPFTLHSIKKQLWKMGFKNLDTTQGPEYEQWLKIVSDDTYQRINKKISSFVDDRIESGYRPADITLDFRTSTLGSIGRCGAYESGLGKFRSFTIYTPFLVKDGLKWDISLIEERRILKELIRKKIPEFADIGEEEVGSIESKGTLSTFVNKLDFVARGSGIMAEEWYRNNKFVRNAFLEDMNNKNVWFYKLVPAAANYRSIWKMSPARMNSIWEMKRLIDCIEDKKYMEF